MPKDLFSDVNVGAQQPRGPMDLFAPARPPEPEPPKQTRRGKRQQSTAAERISYEAGFPVLPESDLTIKERADLGMGDTPDERALKFRQAYAPEGDYATVTDPATGIPRDIYRRDPTEPWRMRDEPGFTAADLIDDPRELATLGLQAGAAALGPAGIGTQLALQAGLSGLSHLGKEGIEEARGYQLQPGTEVAKEALAQTGMDLAAGALPAGVAKVLSGPRANISRTIWNDFSAMQQLRDLVAKETGDKGALDVMTHQMRPDMLVFSRLAAQAGSMSPAMKAAFTKQQMDFADLISRTVSDVPGRAGRTITAQGRPALSRQKNEIMRDFKMNNEEAGKAIRGIFDMESPNGFYRKSRQEINVAYDKAGQLAEGVRFDLTPAQRTAGDVTAGVPATKTTLEDSMLVDLRGKPLTQNTVIQYVNVAQSPGEKVNRVARLLGAIDPEQANWEVVKELRSQVGEVIARNPADESVKSGAAKRLYGSLTQVMENPVGGNKRFVDAWKNANTLAKKRFDVYESARVQKMIAEDSPSAVGKLFANDPDNLTPVIREVVDQYSPEKRKLIKNSVLTGILESPNSAKRIVDWESGAKGNRQAYDWLFENKTDRMQFRNLADRMDELRASPLNQLVESSTRQIDRGKELLSKVGPAELEMTMRQLGGKGSKGVEAMRMAAIDDFLNKTMKFTDEGLPTIDARGLTKAIAEAKRTGVWEKLLTKEDKIRLQGMAAYSRRVFKSLTDTGTTLEQAQIVAGLKHPSTMLTALHGMMMNTRVMAPLVMSKTAKRMFRPKAPSRGPTRKDAWFVFGGQFATELAQLATEMSAEDIGQ